MIAFSSRLIKDDNAARIINIIGCLILAKLIIRDFKKGSKKVIAWAYVGVAACLLGVLLDLILLTL